MRSDRSRVASCPLHESSNLWRIASDSLRYMSSNPMLPAADGTPETAAMRAVLLDEIEAALEELPRGQREVFIAQELDGLTFRELAERSGESINTLLSRKRYAVLQLRERLQAVYEEWLAE